eukprot:TRINITY_DN5213_c1_g1_i1.p1 TRINITY_DN5213_c1_g1~~TRINITY_DN5213_c1_g1_i1.p1  ORF type:complete len:305 (+),score=63.55 TRINITY_DN5213_c1_g1_i1:59-973(+)
MPTPAERALQVGFPERFEVAERYQERLLPLETTSEIGVKERLLLYALRQQGKEGTNQTPAPSWWNATDRAKWDAWNALGTMSTMEAMVYYTKTLDELRPTWLVDQLEHEESAAASPPEPAPAPAPLVVVATTSTPPARPRCTPGPKPASQQPAVPCGPSTPLVLRPQPAARNGTGEDPSLTVHGLRRQIDTLQYRLTCALRDVQARDDLVAELRSENAALRKLLTENGISAPAPAPSATAGQLLLALDRVEKLHGRARQQPQPEGLRPETPPGQSTASEEAAYYQPERRGILAWLTGATGDVRV